LARFKIKKSTVVVLVFVILCLTTIRLSTPARNILSPFEIWFRDILAPLQSGVSTITRVCKDTFQGIWSFKDLQRENEELKKRIDKLVAETNLLEEYRLQNIRLRELLTLKSALSSEYELEAAEVIARDLKSWNQRITINKGSQDGLAKDMAVLTYRGLVGRINSVTAKTAEVVLITDRQGATAAVLQSSRFPGVVESIADNSGLLQMIHLPFDAPVQENDVVVSSGLGQIIPKGLRIGYVVDVKVEPNGLMKRAILKPFADLSRIEEVLVVTGVKGGE
jgi:rod shape-determining protein MreC